MSKKKISSRENSVHELGESSRKGPGKELMKMCISSFVGATLAIIALHGSPSRIEIRNVRTESLEIVDTEGNARGIFQVGDEDALRLVFMDSSQNVRCEIIQDDSRDNTAIVFREKETPNAVLGLSPIGPSLFLKNSSGENSFFLGSTPDGWKEP